MLVRHLIFALLGIIPGGLAGYHFVNEQRIAAEKAEFAANRSSIALSEVTSGTLRIFPSEVAVIPEKEALSKLASTETAHQERVRTIKNEVSAREKERAKVLSELTAQVDEATKPKNGENNLEAQIRKALALFESEKLDKPRAELADMKKVLPPKPTSENLPQSSKALHTFKEQFAQLQTLILGIKPPGEAPSE